MPDPEDSDTPRRDGDPQADSTSSRALRLLLDRFLGIDPAFRQLLQHDGTFRELCEEYAVCTETLERLVRDASDSAMVREFCVLRLRIEGELLRYVSDHRISRSQD